MATCATVGGKLRRSRAPFQRMESSTQEETPILMRVAAGEPGAVQACLDRYSALVWSLARRWLQDADAAEDAVQEIFIDVWRSAARFDPSIASEVSFITVIARRRLIDRRRSSSRSPISETIDEELIDVGDDDLARIERSDEARRAAEAIRTLDANQREVLVLSVMRGLSHSQIASKTGLPLGTVKSHARRGLERVRRMLEFSQPGAASEATS